MTTKEVQENIKLDRDVIQAFDNLSGLHAGYRPTHAKGILLSGIFEPAQLGRQLSCAAHIQRDATPVWIRFSDFGGIPSIPDDAPEASPRGMAIRFRLAEHVHTDIVAHSTNGFPTRTAAEFLEFLQALYRSGSDATKPTPVDNFLGSHPAALRFVKTPKPMPVSFAKESYYAVSAYRFTNAAGETRFGRYHVLPVDGPEYFSDARAVGNPPDYLRQEILTRLVSAPVKFVIAVQLAESVDVVDDATVQWPDERAMAKLGTLTIDSLVPDNESEQQHIIFDPIPRLDGIAPSNDPLLEPRASVYLMSGRRRRAVERSEPA